jgi:hypothetical protein
MAQRAVTPFYVPLTTPLFETRRGLQSCFYGADNDEDEDNEGEEGDEDESGSEDTGKKGKGGTDDEESEAEKLRKRLVAADRNQSALQQKIKEFEDKDKSEAERLQSENESLKMERDQLAGEVSGLRLQNTFLMSNTYAWDDPEYALDFAQRKGYLDDVIADDGSVDAKALGKALDKLAKDKPKMIKGESDDNEDEDLPNTSGGVGNRRKKKADKDEAELRRRFPNAYR